MTKGEITLIAGPVKSGKTSTLVSIVAEAIKEGKKTLVLSPAADTRVEGSFIRSRNGDIALAHRFCGTVSLHDIVVFEELVIIDEANIAVYHENRNMAWRMRRDFIESIQAIAVKGANVVIACCDLDFRGDAFSPFTELRAIADHVVMLTARCEVCGEQATHSHRPTPETTTLSVGDHHEAMCASCFLESVNAA